MSLISGLLKAVTVTCISVHIKYSLNDKLFHIMVLRPECHRNVEEFMEFSSTGP